MVSGFYLAEYVKNKKHDETNKPLYMETLGYIWKTIKKIIPYYIGACLISFMVVSIVRFENYKILLLNFYQFVAEIFMLQMAGFSTYTLIGTEWYLSALIIALIIIFPLLNRYTDMMTHIIAPFLSIMIFGWIAHECGYLTNTGYWTGMCYEGVLKAIASILAGVTCHEIVDALKEKQCNKRFKICITLVELLVWFMTLCGMINGEKYSNYDFILALWIFVGLCITLSGITYTDRFINQAFSDFCAKLSIPLFLCHGYLLLVLPQYVETLEKWRALFVFLALVLFSILIDLIIVKGLFWIKREISK